MKNRTVFFGIGLVSMLAASAPETFSQVQAAQNRISQDIVINGQMVHGVYVTAPGGQMQSFTCPAPQHYTTADNRVQGWACYEAATGIWLLNAVPPTQDPSAPVPVPVPQQPPGIYQQAPPPIVYQPAPTVIYQQPVPTVIYQQPAPTVIYQQPVVVQSVPHRPIIVAPAYPSSVVLGTAAIDAAGRIASAAIIGSHRGERYYSERRLGHGHRW